MINFIDHIYLGYTKVLMFYSTTSHLSRRSPIYKDIAHSTASFPSSTHYDLAALVSYKVRIRRILMLIFLLLYILLLGLLWPKICHVWYQIVGNNFSYRFIMYISIWKLNLLWYKAPDLGHQIFSSPYTKLNWYTWNFSSKIESKQFTIFSW